MKKLKWRSAVVAGLAAVTLSAPAAASAATTTATTHAGSWNLIWQGSNSIFTPRFATHSTVRGCASAALLGSGMSFEIVWYNGGRDTVLWESRNFGGERTCSPTKTIRHARNPSVFLVITVKCPPQEHCRAHGAWTLTTNR